MILSKKNFIIILALIVILVLALAFYLGWRSLSEKQGGGEAAGELTEEFLELPKSAPQLLVAENIADYQELLKTKNISPDGSQGAFLEREGEVIYLKITDLKTNQTKKVERVSLEDVDLVWQKPDEIFFVEKPSASWPASAWSYNLKDKSFGYLFKNEAGLMVNWLSDGLVLKFSNAGPQVPALTLVRGGQETALPFVTLPNKCAFFKNKIYCAIPAVIGSDVVLPDDYLKNKFYSQDKIISLQLEPIDAEVLFVSNEKEKVDAVDLAVIKDELYFTNRYDGKVYKLQ